MNPLAWLLLGAFVGFGAAMAYAQVSARRTNRGLELRWRVAGYTSRTKPW